MKYNYAMESATEFNRGNVFEFSGQAHVTFYLENKEYGVIKDGFSRHDRIKVDMFFSEDTDVNGFVDFLIHHQPVEGEEKLIKLDGVDPESLYYIGRVLTNIAKHFGFNKRSVSKLNRDHMLGLNLKGGSNE